jgi:hypothetical protein
MLRHDVTKAVEEGKFHIYAHRNVDEGIALLSGVQAGEPLPGGGYPEESVNFRVNRRLLDLAQKIRNFAPPPSD